MTADTAASFRYQGKPAEYVHQRAGWGCAHVRADCQVLAIEGLTGVRDQGWLPQRCIERRSDVDRLALAQGVQLLAASLPPEELGDPGGDFAAQGERQALEHTKGGLDQARWQV